MPSTSVHMPASLLEDLDRLAAESGVSRNRLIVEAVRETLRSRHRWPADFFDDSRFSPDELAELREHADEFTAEILSSRNDRVEPPF